MSAQARVVAFDAGFERKAALTAQHELESNLKGIINQDAQTRTWQMAENTSPGAVRSKLRQARAVAQLEPEFAENVKVLEAVHPASRISANPL